MWRSPRLDATREPSPARNSRALRTVAGLLTLGTVLYWLRVSRIGIADFSFDDALMFLRYAMHLRHGYGLAWDPGGPHTFGMTSLTWMAVVLLGSYLPLPPVALVAGLSCLVGLAAMVCLAASARLVFGAGARAPLALLFPAIAFPLLLSAHFALSLSNGMETMLALLLLAAFLALVQRAFLSSGLLLPAAAGGVGWLTVLTRPEALLAVISFPLCWWLLVEHRRHARVLVTALVAVAALVSLTLLAATLYFGTPVPLAFYIKSLRGYAGYRLYLNPAAYTCYFFNMAIVPCLVLGLLAERRHTRVLLAFAVPLLLQLAYLASVLQIMGWGGRYYVPYLALLFVPAVLLTDEWVGEGWRALPAVTGPRLVVLLVTMLVANLQTTQPVYELVGRLVVRHWMVYEPPEFVTASHPPLPAVGWWEACSELGRLAASLPPGASVSSSEVGMLGALAPEVRVIDTSGLNDTAFAMHGFSAHELLARQPDVIWLIHSDYTHAYGELASDPELLRHYTLYAGAFSFGVAIRNDGPHHREVVAAFQRAWNDVYPGYDMQQYVAQQVRWNSTPYNGRYSVAVVQP